MEYAQPSFIPLICSSSIVVQSLACSAVIVSFMEPCARALGGQCFLLVMQQNRGKRVCTCECSTGGGRGVYIVFNRWVGKGVCACELVYVDWRPAGVCSSPSLLLTSEVPPASNRF